MESQETSAKMKWLFSRSDLSKYDITECLDILRYLQTFDKAELKTEEFKKFSYQLECRIKSLVLQK
ncbi:hypothetical protein AAE02nite_25660 [Adhaeribacter aerolatus]|uniref:Four helix bundle protein n=2 Tax=Adhaeribacter aerolatus TaxID=670289 RepID=A0A512AYW0_9BACT|nr:hypothetical protein AAE02nite_25660 [Adhaeribacter aerolatus]